MTGACLRAAISLKGQSVIDIPPGIRPDEIARYLEDERRAKRTMAGCATTIALLVAFLVYLVILGQTPDRPRDSPAIQQMDQAYDRGRRDARSGRSLTAEQMQRQGMSADEQRHYRAGRDDTNYDR